MNKVCATCDFARVEPADNMPLVCVNENSPRYMNTVNDYSVCEKWKWDGIVDKYTDLLRRVKEAVEEINNESIYGVAPSGVFNHDNIWQDSADKCWRIMHKYFGSELEAQDDTD
jgi:hypothetical protein